VNVGHRGLFRYSRILQRQDGQILPIPTALIPDRDIPPDAAAGMVQAGRRTEGTYTAPALATHMGVIWLKKEKVAVWDSFKINSLQVFFV